MIVVLLLRIVCVLGAMYIAFFSLWRTFEREHIDDIPKVFDRLVIAAIAAVYLSRIPSLVELLLSQTISPLSALSPLVGTSSWQVGIILFLLLLYVFLKNEWRDRYAVLDLVVVSLCVLISGSLLSDTISVAVSSLFFDAQLSIAYGVTILIGCIYFIAFGRLLAYFERQYRAYFWYRYRRSSAQTGFVTSVFCIGAGLFGIVSNLHQVPYGVLTLPMFLTLFSLFTAVGGFILLYIRSGRLKKR